MKRRTRIILSVCLAVLLVIGIGGYAYVSDYYHADETALEATSGGSGMGKTVDELRKLCPNADWKAGKLINGVSDQAIAAWAAKFS